MQTNHGKRSSAFWARGIAAICAALSVAAGASALAAPTETVLCSFTGGSDGSLPYGGLIADSTGNLYGTTSSGGASVCNFGEGCGVVFKLSPVGTETVLYSFMGGFDGATPLAGLIADSNGNLYGTTQTGGGGGTVFKLSPGGTETVLYSFTGSLDGSRPQASLIVDRSGNLYGTTPNGGTGYGVVFKLSPGGTETVLYYFMGGSDGADPSAGLIADVGGNLYGTASGGASGNGVVFKLTPGVSETALHSFSGSDGAAPAAGLIADSSGNFYGTTAFGGASGNGVVFKLTPSGTYTVLYSFTGSPSDGANPEAGLIADSAGNLYGTTEFGSGSGSGCGGQGCGVVFKLTPSGTETVLYTFTGGSDGARPQAGLVADGSGNLFGTTSEGGTSGKGTVFKLAGTGFVPGVPFLAFNAALEITLGSAPNQNALVLGSAFTLSSTAPAIDPVAQPVTLKVGNFTATIPPGYFVNFAPGAYYLAGFFFGDVGMEALLEQTGTLRYSFYAAAWGAAGLAGTANPVPVTLSIGSDTGAISVNAYIVNGAAAAAHR